MDRRMRVLLGHLRAQEEEPVGREVESVAVGVAGAGFFRVLDVGDVEDPDATHVEKRRPIVLDVRESRFRADPSLVKPHTTLVLVRHIVHVARLMRALHIHLKYVEDSGDCYIMFRTPRGLVPYTTINNRHWIRYMLMHAVGREDVEKAGEGEFRLEVATELDGNIEFSCNVVYIQGGVKLTLSPTEDLEEVSAQLLNKDSLDT